MFILQEQTKQNQTITNWSIYNVNYIEGYEDEMIKGQSIQYYSKLSRISQAPLTIKQHIYKYNDLLEDAKECIQSLNIIIDSHGTHNRNGDLSKFVAFSAIRIKLRLENIIDQLQKGAGINEVFMPYALEKNRYLYPQLFIKVENELSKKYESEIIEVFKKWKKDDRVPGLDPEDCMKALQYLMNLPNSSSKSLAELLCVLLQPGPYGQFSAFRFSFKKIHQQLASHHWQPFISFYLKSEQNIKLLDKQVSLMEIINLFLTQTEKPGLFFLENIQLLQNLADYVPQEFFDLVENLSLIGHAATLKAGLQPGEYMKSLLMHGLAYSNIIDFMLENFIKYKSHATLVIYEALTRGDRDNLNKLLNASNQHWVNKLVTKQNFTENKLKQKTHKELTIFNESISYSFPGLLEYIKIKHSLTKDPQKLYFISQLEDFAKILVEIGLISERQEFTSIVPQMFSLKTMDDTETTTRTKKRNCNVMEVEQKDDQDKYSRLETLIFDLTERMIEVEKKNEQLSNEVTFLKKVLFENNISMDVAENDSLRTL